MAWASVSGAIDYSTDDGSPMFLLRERVVLDIVASQRQYEWSAGAALRSAVLSRGTSWLVPDSSAKVAKDQFGILVAAEKKAIEAAYPYQAPAVEVGDGLPTDREVRMRAIYRQRFGGDPGSKEAEETIAKLQAQHLPKNQADPEVVKSTGTWRDAEKSRLSFAERMKPRRTRWAK